MFKSKRLVLGIVTVFFVFMVVKSNNLFTNEANKKPKKIKKCEACVLKTGQTNCWDSLGAPITCAGTGQDGELQKGAARSYTDNGDGTITDNTTGLMWEKLTDDGSIHDWDNVYTWEGAFAKIAALNAANFAG